MRKTNNNALLFSFFLIPSVGECVVRKGFDNAVNATETARAEARLLFKRDIRVTDIEIVTCERDEAVHNEFSYRSDLRRIK